MFVVAIQGMKVLTGSFSTIHMHLSLKPIAIIEVMTLQ